jgi:hypothetical protein
MRAVHPDAHALRLGRGGLALRILIWIEARNRATGTIEGFGLQTGEDTEESR